jgi:predicted NBD/HSP70 family sugar kinase
MIGLIDIGATNTRVGISNDGKGLSKYKIFQTSKTYFEEKRLVAEELKSFSEGGVLERTIIGIPGVLSKEKKLIRSSLSDYLEKEIVGDFEELLNCEVVVENDADLSALGEANFGSSKGYKISGYITVSSGVGGARTVGGKLDKNFLGFEPGKQILDFKKKLKYFEKRVDWESEVAGNSVKKKIGKNPWEVKNDKFWREYSEVFAIGLFNTSLFWSPEIIVLGGGLGVSEVFPLENVRKVYVELITQKFDRVPELKTSRLKQLSGLYGAIAYNLHNK